MRSRIPFALAAAALLAGAAGAQAPASKSTVLSIQPLTAMATIYSGELEQRLSRSLTLGVGGSHWSIGDQNKFSYNSGDVKLRYYPEGHSLSGFAVGMQGGYTSVAEKSTDATTGAVEEHKGSAPTMGISLDYNWLLGENRSFYLGLGIGGKRVFINSDRFHDPRVSYPTGRLSIGYAF